MLTLVGCPRLDKDTSRTDARQQSAVKTPMPLGQSVRDIARRVLR